MYLRGIGYAFVASLMFGLGAILAKLLSGAFDSSVIAVLTLAVSGLLLAALLAFSRTPLLSALRAFTRRDWLDVLLLAFPGTALPLVVIVDGFAQTSALEGGLLLQFNGLAALLLAVLLLGERIHWKQGVGVLLLLPGGALIVIAGAGGGSGPNSSLGNLLILIGSAGIGYGYIPAKRLVQRIDPLSLSALRLLLGAATVAPVTAFQLVTARSLLWQPTPTNLTLLLLYTVTNFCLAYLAQQAGLRLLKAWQVAAIGQTVPLFSTLFALLLLHESLTLLQGMGGLLAVLGGIVVSLHEEAAPPRREAALAAVQPAHETEQAPLADESMLQ
ncbi:MAG TPA: DMT family transporter [Ktedonobacterales bacterium]|nr:DMT family transporter [Ktedonobacterales bacterium]